MEFSLTAQNIFEDIQNQGGEVYIVGGSVRDYLLGDEDKTDVDVEIYGLTYDELYQILSSYGYVNTFGKAFAIMQLDHLKGYDFALPRQEFKVGQTHQDFKIDIDPFLSKEKAVQRRDLTINGLMYSFKTAEILDFVGGQEDIKNRIARCIHKDTFIEDPLRVLRVAQMISRFGLSVEDETKKLCQTMVQQGMLDHLAIERIYDEYCKILMSPKPSLGFEFLKEIDALPPYLKELITTNQRLDYHPEGDVFTHTMLVLDVAALSKHKADEPLSFMWSCLLHDIGKPAVTTEDGHAPGHNMSGVDAFKDVNLIQSQKQRKYIKTMIQYHMHLMNMSLNNAKDLKFLRLLKEIDGRVSLNDLVLISRCDKLGRGKVAYGQYDSFDEYIEDHITRLGNKAPKAMIDGELLLKEGFKQSKDFSKILDEAYDLQLQGLDSETIIRSLKKIYDKR